MNSAAEWIAALQLQEHPEGGWFAETFRSSEVFPAGDLPPRYTGDRAHFTSIYFLLEKGQFSALHRLQTDEIWHFHDGAPLEIVSMDAQGNWSVRVIGRDVAAGHFPQALVPRGHWFGARSLGDFTLVGCTMAPGFEFADFEMGDRVELTDQYPQHAASISEFTL